MVVELQSASERLESIKAFNEVKLQRLATEFNAGIDNGNIMWIWIKQLAIHLISDEDERILFEVDIQNEISTLLDQVMETASRSKFSITPEDRARFGA